MRRDYGSNLFNELDRPINGELTTKIYLDIVESLFICEPRFEVDQVAVGEINQGKITID